MLKTRVYSSTNLLHLQLQSYIFILTSYSYFSIFSLSAFFHPFKKIVIKIINQKSMWTKINIFDIFTFRYFYLSIFLIFDIFTFRYFYISTIFSSTFVYFYFDFLPFDISTFRHFPFSTKVGITIFDYFWILSCFWHFF
jgi:hypothetical protein